MHVLLGIRQPDLRLALELLLGEEPGVTVVGAASETEGLLALLETSCPDLVFLDWDLPGRPAVSVLAASQALASPPQVIVLGQEPGIRQAALEAGADAFVMTGGPPTCLLAAFRQAQAARRRVAVQSAAWSLACHSDVADVAAPTSELVRGEKGKTGDQQHTPHAGG